MAFRQWALPSLKPAAVLGGVFAALFAQMQALVFLSLIDYRPVLLVQRFMPQLDLSDFIVATGDWLHGINPYLRERFDKPPPALLTTLPLQHLNPSHAALAFFVANIAVMAAVLRVLCRHYRLGRVESLLLFGIASMYFPVIFLVERGNLDGIMLGLMLMAIFAKNPVVRALGLALSAGIKLYSALLFVPLLVAHRWKLAVLTMALLVLLLVPFHSVLVPFLHRQTNRNGEFHVLENISPALFVEIFSKAGVMHLVYYGAWLLCYMAFLYRRSQDSLESRMVCSMPWMMALPVHVYVYTGVVLLPVLVLRSREMAKAGALFAQDYVFLLGFLLAGFQQTAWMACSGGSMLARVLCHLANPAGTALVILSFILRVREGADAEVDLSPGGTSLGVPS